MAEHVFRRDDVEAVLRVSGLDPREASLVKDLDNIFAAAPEGGVTLESAYTSVGENSAVVKALTGRLAVPKWGELTTDLLTIYNEIQRDVHSGHNADYIGVLAEQDPSWFGVAVCTVDGQRWSYGDAQGEFSIQSCVKPLMYCVAVEETGLARVHRHIGIEPSGLAFNEVSLNADHRPHNPMINAGAIASGSLIKRTEDAATRFRVFTSRLRELSGGLHIGFSQPTYLCEIETAWRNNALMYYMTEAGVFPEEQPPEVVLDFYIQCCAIEVTCESASVIAATLANGGTCPLTQKRCLSPLTVKSCLTLMFSCGMYDYSGEWCVQVGLPAKSGVAGLVYVVVPHVMGVATWSPPLDIHGNSVRGVEFFKRLLAKYNFGIFDQIVSQGLGGGSTLSTHKSSSKAAGVARTAKGARGGAGTPSSTGVRSAGKSPTRASAGGFPDEPPKTKRGMSEEAVLQERAAQAGSWRRLLGKLGKLKLSFSRLTGDPRRLDVPTAVVKEVLSMAGVASTKRANPAVYNLIKRIEREGRIHFADLLEPSPSGDDDNVIVKALLDTLVMPSFPDFCRDIREIYAEAIKERGGEVPSHLPELSAVDSERFGVAVCTVDGQQFSYGDADIKVPLMQTIKPLLYAMALKDVGNKQLHTWVGTEPTSFEPESFHLMPVATGHGGGGASGVANALWADGSVPTDDEDGNCTLPHSMPYNPFMDSGALAVAATVGRSHQHADRRLFVDSGTRFTHVVNMLSEWAGGLRIGFCNPMFLALKQKALKVMALSHYMKGMSCYPTRTAPDDNAHVLFQAESVEMTCAELAVVASTIASMGVCPTSGKRVLDSSVIRSVLSLMYSCGMKRFGGTWNFNVGIPATSGSSGLLLVIIPNVMGLVLHSPRVNEYDVSPRSYTFCRILTRRYRVNLFDQLVYGDMDIAVGDSTDTDGAKDTSSTEAGLLFELCSAAARGDVATVSHLISDGANVCKGDYDKRTALHHACKHGHPAVVELLLDNGASALQQDRFGQTAAGEAVLNNRAGVISMLAAKGVHVPSREEAYAIRAQAPSRTRSRSSLTSSHVLSPMSIHGRAQAFDTVPSGFSLDAGGPVKLDAPARQPTPEWAGGHGTSAAMAGTSGSSTIGAVARAQGPTPDALTPVSATGFASTSATATVLATPSPGAATAAAASSVGAGPATPVRPSGGSTGRPHSASSRSGIAATAPEAHSTSTERRRGETSPEAPPSRADTVASVEHSGVRGAVRGAGSKAAPLSVAQGRQSADKVTAAADGAAMAVLKEASQHAASGPLIDGANGSAGGGANGKRESPPERMT